MELESKSRCDCWNTKWFLADANAYRHSLKNRWELERLQAFETSSLRSTPIIQSFRAALRSYYFTQELKIFSTMNPRRKLTLNAMALVIISRLTSLKTATKLQAFLAKCKTNLDYNLTKIVNLMTRNCLHIKPAAMTCYTRTQSHSLLTRNQKHFAGTDEKPLQEERLNYLIKQAKSPFMKESSGLSLHIMFLKSVLTFWAACRPSS